MKTPTFSSRFRRAVAVLACGAFMSLAASPASAASSDDDEALPDARLTGYAQPVALGGGAALTFATLAILGVISVGMTFKNANRSHLD